MKKELAVLAVAAVLIGMAGAANYMYEKASVKGVGYKNVEMIISTQIGYSGAKLVEKESGSGNVITEKTELEAERQLNTNMQTLYPSATSANGAACPYWNTYCPMDYINFTKDAEFEYMPVSYQTGTYDQKWIEKLCVQNYRIGAVVTEMYTHAESLQKHTEVKTRLYSKNCTNLKCCTGVLEANLKSDFIGVFHAGWLSKDPLADATNLKGRHAEYGRSVEDLTGVFQIEKFIQLWGNSTCQEISVDWLPCV
jgi:hypothetical protein